MPFTGAGPAAQAALAGTTDLAGVNISAVMPLIKAGKLRALVQTGAKRWFELPDTPTMEEAGIANAESETLQVLLGPQNMPGEITDRLSKAVVKALAAPELREQLLKTGFAVSGTGSAELKQLTGRNGKWRDVIAEPS